MGDDAFQASFPLVQQQGGTLTKIIKPLRLDHEAPQDIYEHGDVWLQKIKRLRNRNLLPSKVLFAVQAPPRAHAKRHAAFQEICTDLIKLDVQTVEADAHSMIIDFALG